MEQNGIRATSAGTQDGGKITKHYVDVLFMNQLNGSYGYTYEVPEHFVKDLQSSRNIVVVEGRGGLLALAYVINKFKGYIENERIKPIHDVCMRVKMNPKRIRVAESAMTQRGQLF